MSHFINPWSTFLLQFFSRWFSFFYIRKDIVELEPIHKIETSMKWILNEKRQKRQALSSLENKWLSQDRAIYKIKTNENQGKSGKCVICHSTQEGQ